MIKKKRLIREGKLCAIIRDRDKTLIKSKAMIKTKKLIKTNTLIKTKTKQKHWSRQKDWSEGLDCVPLSETETGKVSQTCVSPDAPCQTRWEMGNRQSKMIRDRFRTTNKIWKAKNKIIWLWSILYLAKGVQGKLVFPDFLGRNIFMLKVMALWGNIFRNDFKCDLPHV